MSDPDGGTDPREGSEGPGGDHGPAGDQTADHDRGPGHDPGGDHGPDNDQGGDHGPGDDQGSGRGAGDDHSSSTEGGSPEDTGQLRIPGAPAQVGPSAKDSPDEPVTVVISRLVRSGYEQDYNDWIHEAARLLEHHDGFQGMTALPPGQHHSGPEHVLVLRFRDYSSMRAWKRSEARRRWIGRLEALTVDVGAWQEQTGLETWFTLDSRATPTGPPPRWKQSLLTLVGLLPLLLIMELTFGRLLSDLPAWARILTTTPLVVAAMAWLVMPAITRVSYRWLYPGQDR